MARGENSITGTRTRIAPHTAVSGWKTGHAYHSKIESPALAKPNVILRLAEPYAEVEWHPIRKRVMVKERHAAAHWTWRPVHEILGAASRDRHALP
jgi:hypothetical protein